jgi:hypothetical protein
MKHLALALLLSSSAALVACGGKSKPAETPTDETPTTTTTEPAADDCYTQCLANGPGDPASAADWAGKPQEEKENDCSAQCADANMPVEE